MASKEPVVTRTVATDPNLEPAPIDRAWIVEGEPQARSRSLSLSPDRTIGATLWDCSAGLFDWHYGRDEMVHILDGEVDLTSPSGSVSRLRAGDMVWFPAGQVVRWHVPVYVRKVTVYSAHSSLPRRLAHRLPLARRIVQLLRGVRSRSGSVSSSLP